MDVYINWSNNFNVDWFADPTSKLLCHHYVTANHYLSDLRVMVKAKWLCDMDEWMLFKIILLSVVKGITIQLLTGI